MKSRAIGAFLIALLGMVGFSLPVLAQTTGDLEGVVSDGSGAPLPGVAVEIRSSSLIGTRSVVTDGAGRYRFPALPPGTYVVTGSMSGFTKAERTNIRVSLGATATVNMSLSVSRTAEVVVTGEAPVVDTTRSVIGTNATVDQIQRLPLGRNFTAIAQTVAGTGTSVGGGLTVYGATGLENQYIIDGVNTTGVKIGAQGKQMNNEFIQEVEVKTGGYEAEFSRALGGVINVVTKSGGNEFHGDVFGYLDASGLASDDKRSQDRADAGQGPFYAQDRYDVGVGLGGFMMKDRIWFFGAYNRVGLDQDYQQATGVEYFPPSADPKQSFRTIFSSSVDTTSTSRNLFSGKVTLRLGEQNTVSFSVFGDPAETDGRLTEIISPNPNAYLGTNKAGGTNLSLKYDGIFGTQFLVQAQVARHSEKDEDYYSEAGEKHYAIRDRRRRQDVWTGDGVWFIQREKYDRDNARLAGSWFTGAHEIKGGLDFEDIKGNYYGAYGGGGRVTNFLSSGTGEFVEGGARYYATVPVSCKYKYDADGNVITGNFGTPGPGNPNGVTSIYDCLGYGVLPAVINEPRTQNLGIFLQDSWKILGNLTVNAGLRFDDQKLKDANGDVRIHLKLADSFSPRVGVVWDFMNNGKSKAYAHYGRFYTTIPADIQTRALGNEYTVFAYNYGEKDQFDPIDTATGYAYIQGGQLTYDGIKGMYQDEIIAGVEYELFPNWAFGIKGIYKALGRAIEDRCDLLDYRLPYLADYVPAGSLTSCALVNPGQGQLGTLKDPSNPDCVGPDGLLTGDCESTQVRRYYRGLELSTVHRFADNFFLSANYIYSKLEGNYDGNEKQGTGQQDPNINADFDYIDMIPNNFGRLSLDREHQFKVSGSYSFPFGLTTGGAFRYASGAPMLVCGLARAGYPCTKYLTDGRGEIGSLPAEYEMDLHLEYSLRLGPVTVTPVVDVFNLLNRQGVTGRNMEFNPYTASQAGLPSGKDPNDPKSYIGVIPGCTTATANYNSAACSTNATYLRDNRWQNPRQFRLGARVSF